MNPFDYPVCLSHPRRLTTTSAWVGHIPFAMALVQAMRPNMIVELGSYTGESYCAMCQAVLEAGLTTRCFAVDTWQGDKHASFYGAEVLDDLRSHHDLYYADFSTLLQSTFDEALRNFKDDSIDLLHVDGLHTYEAVKHDFDSWLPKMSKRGVVLFHDTHVHKGDFGVWKFWAEIREHYPHFEFQHSAGLGVLCVGPNVPQPIMALSQLNEAQTKQVQHAFWQLAQRLKGHVSQRVNHVRGAVVQMFGLKPGDVDHHMAMANLLLAVGDYESARRELLYVLRSNPQHGPAHAGMATILLEMDAEGAAVQSLEAAMQHGSLNPDAMRTIAARLIARDQCEAAMRYLEQLLAAFPHDAASLQIKAVCCEKMQGVDEAIAICRTWRLHHPQSVEAHRESGRLLEQAGQHTEALACYHEALKLNPTDEATLRLLGALMAHLGHADEARKVYQMLLSINPYVAACGLA